MAGVLCLKEPKLLCFEVAQPPSIRVWLSFVPISYASSKQEKYEEFIDYIPFMNVRLQAASLKTFQSP